MGAAGASAFASGFPAIAGGGNADRPNIIMVIADDLAWHDIGCYGSEDVKTPHIDRLASQGMKFNSCFTATAMCSPTRQQLYTGLFPVRNGAYPNHSKVKPGTRSMVHYLSDLGYRVGLIGKKHIGPRDSFPFDRPGNLKNLPKTVRSYITKDKSKPWCLLVASHNPHSPWNQGPDYDPDRIHLPPYLLDTQSTRETVADYYGEITALDEEVGQCMDAVRETGQEENTVFIFTSEQGCAFPGGKWTCYEAGLHTAFIVRWPGRVKAGTETDAMVQYVDVVPTLLEAAGVNPNEIDTGCPDPTGYRGFDGKSFLDVMRGRADEHNDYVYGVHTTKGIINGKPYPVRSVRGRRYKYIRNLMPDATFQNIVTRGGKRHSYWPEWVEKSKTDRKAALLVRRYQHRPAQEFYDLQQDPWELNNLSDNRAWRGEMKGMDKVLQAWMKQQGDEGVRTELGKA